MNLEEAALLQHRILFLAGGVDSDTANRIVAQLLLLDAQDPEAQIDLYINSRGGNIGDGLAIIDAMTCIQAPVSTICIGQAMSMAARILAAGQKGRRFATPNSEIMLHLMQVGLEGDSVDIQINAQRIARQQSAMIDMLARWTGQDRGKIEKDIDRDFFMTAEEAREYGLIDQVLRPHAAKDGLGTG